MTPNQDTNLPTLTDPVCGTPVSAAAPQYLHAHGGAMFFFCSEACRARFLADPARFVSMRVQSPDVPPPSVAPAPAPRAAEPARPARVAPRLAQPARAPEQGLRRGGLRSLIAGQILAWREGRYAVRTTRELLALYRMIAAAHPELAGRALFRRMVMERSGCDAAAADLVLEDAEDSFASWPVRRELTLCDVVHYLSVAGFLAEHKGEHWMHADIAHIVASRLPHDLCVIRKNK